MDAAQMQATTAAAVRLIGRSAATVAAARCSAMTSAGIIRTMTMMPRGTNNTSSRYPSTGMKSGTRSIGESAYPATRSASAFAYQGVRGSRAARYTAWASRLMIRAHSLRRLLIGRSWGLRGNRKPPEARGVNMPPLSFDDQQLDHYGTLLRPTRRCLHTAKTKAAARCRRSEPPGDCTSPLPLSWVYVGRIFCGNRCPLRKML